MKLVMDEKLKHRLVGLAVIISLGAIFAPAMLKKSSQRLESNMSVNVKLPPKPVAPDVVLTDEKEMFKTIKVAKVEIQPVPEKRQLTELVKAEPVKSEAINIKQIQQSAQNAANKPNPVHLALNSGANTTAKNVIKLANVQNAKQPAKVALNKSTGNKVKEVKPVNVAKVSNSSTSKKDIYAVQLASFSQLSNAQALVTKLRGKGYKANFSKSVSRRGAIYKVYVGHSPYKMEVLKLKTQLASAMQLNGFVVNTGVS